MDQSTITKLTRRGIQEPRAVNINDDEIESMTTEAVYHLGMIIKTLDSSKYHTRLSVTSLTNMFTKPTDCITVLRVWDMMTSAVAVTAASNTTPIMVGTATEFTVSGATNASPIVITTSAVHGYETGDSIFIGGVTGNTAANGKYTITKLSTTTFSLDDSEGNAAYVSGGKAIKASLAHGLSDNDVATVHGCLGNTAANGTFKITKANLVNGSDGNTYKCIAAHTAAAANKPVTGADYEIYWEQESTGVHGTAWISGSSYILSDFNFSLDGSVGNAAWTSGGYVFKPTRNFTPITKINLEEARNNNRRVWYPISDNIVVDDIDFENDIILDYDKLPSAITDIPTAYHMGLVNFNVLHLMRLPEFGEGKQEEYHSKMTNLKTHQASLDRVEKSIYQTFQQSGEPTHIVQEIDFNDYT